MKQPIVFIIHTSAVSLEYLNDLFRELSPATVVRNIVDDSLLPEVLANSGVTPMVTRRICQYACCAEAAGADLIFNQCSSVGEAADLAARLVKVPLVKVDERMAEVACHKGHRIGVVATLKTTLGPTVRLVQKKAAVANASIQIIERLCEGAFDLLIKGDRQAHNQLVIKNIRELEKEADVIVCAQGSMVALLGDLGETRVPVLTSPRLGVEHAVQVLNQVMLRH